MSENTFRSLLADTWHKLTEPTEAIQELPGRRQAQFLASLLLALVPVGIVATLVPSLVSETKTVQADPSFYVLLMAALMAAIAYRLSRTKDYPLAAVLTVSIASLAIFAASFTDPNPVQLEAAVYLVIPVILASILLSMRATALVAGLHAVGLLLLPFFVPGATWVDSVINPLSYNILLSLLVLLAVRHRNLLEKDRQAELEQLVKQRTAEHEHAETQLAEERNLLRTLIENFPEAIYVKDTRSRFVLANATHARFMGTTPEGIVGKSDHDYFPEPIAAQFFADEQALMESGEPLINHEELLTDDPQAKRWASSTKVPLRDREGKITGLVGVSRDLTAHKQMEAALVEERNLLRTLIDSLPDPVFVKDTQGHILLNNIADAQAFGLTPAEAVGKTDFDLFPKELAEQYHADEQAILQSGTARMNYEELSADTQGSERWSLTTKVPLRDREGNIIGLVGINRDITERKQAEGALHQSHEELEQRVQARTVELSEANARLREQIVERERIEQELQRERDFALQVTNRLGQGIVVTNAERRFTFINPAFAQMLRYEPEHLLGKTLRDISVTDDFPILDQARANRNAGRTTTYEVRLCRADGSQINVLITGVPQWQEQQIVGTIAVITDLTELSQANGLLREQIAERERIEQELQRERDFALQVMNALGQGLTVTDEQRRFVYVNPAFAQMLGYTIEALIGKTPMDLAFQEDLELLDTVRDERRVGKATTYEYRLRHADGTGIPVLITGVPRWQDGKVSGAIGSITDLTGRKQAEQALQASEERYRIITDLISDYAYAYRVEPDGAFIHEWSTDEPFTRLTGYAPSEIAESFALYHPDDIERVRQDVKDSVAGKATSSEYRIITKSGETRWLHIYRRPVWDEGQKRVIRFFGVAQDITERKLAEEALIETNQTLSALIEGSALAIITLDAKARVELWNPAAERLFGYKASEVVGKPYPLVSEDMRSEFNVLFAHILQGGSLYSVELQRRKRDGVMLDVSLSAAPMFDAQGRIVGSITMMADLTERKYAEKALRASEEASRQFQEQLKALHEIGIELAQIVSVDDMCHRAVELGRRRLGFDRLGIWFVDETQAWSLGSFGTDEKGRVRDERGQRVALSVDTIMSEMLTSKQHYYRETATLYNQRHEVIGQGWTAMAALWDGDRVIGSISTDNLLRQQPILPYQLELLTLYGATIGHLCTRKRAEAAERDQRRMAEALRDTAAIINSTLELNKVLDRLLIQVQHVIPNDASTLMLIEDGYANMARFRGYAERGLKDEVSRVRLPVDDTPNLRTMVETGQPLVISDVKQYPDWVLAPETEWIGSHIGAPIHIEGQVIGFLSINSAIPGQFTQTHAERLKAFADQAATAIHNTRLYDEARHHAEALEVRVAQRTAELERERAQLRAILDAMSEGVTGVIMDEEFQTDYHFTNQALFRLFGYSAEEWDPVLIRSEKMSAEEYEVFRQKMEDRVIQYGIWRGEMLVRRKDGSEFDAAVTATRVDGRDAQRIGYVVVFRDISQEKALQDQRSRFVAHASHELRTPITNLKTRLYLMRKQPDKLNEHLAIVEQVTERMKSLVEDLLDLSRLERGVIPLEQETLELQTLVTDVIHVQEPEAERKGIALTCDVAPTPLYIYADRERIMQVITNLVTNALNYTSYGGKVRVVASAHGNGEAVVHVEDTGIGIAPDHLPHIFQPFYRVGDKPGGTGLGLSISREIVEMHQGTIAVESEVGRGSRFTLRFALQEVNNA